MPEVNHLYTAEKLLFVVKRIRNGGGLCIEDLSEYTVVSDLAHQNNRSIPSAKARDLHWNEYEIIMQTETISYKCPPPCQAVYFCCWKARKYAKYRPLE